MGVGWSRGVGFGGHSVSRRWSCAAMTLQFGRGFITAETKYLGSAIAYGQPTGAMLRRKEATDDRSGMAGVR
jgi:hypothetical protein